MAEESHFPPPWSVEEQAACFVMRDWRPIAEAKPKPAPVKKAVRKVKQPVAPAVEQPAPGVITVTEVEETEVRKAS
jgi:hypothetical protein